MTINIRVVVMKPHISRWDQPFQMCFFSPKNENKVETWTKLLNRVVEYSSGKQKKFLGSKHTKIYSNHFEYGRQVEAALNPLLFLKGYGGDDKFGVKIKVPTSRRDSPPRKKILRKEPAFQTKILLPEKKHHPLFPRLSSGWKNQLVQRFLMFLCHLVKLQMSILI